MPCSDLHLKDIPDMPPEVAMHIVDLLQTLISTLEDHYIFPHVGLNTTPIQYDLFKAKSDSLPEANQSLVPFDDPLPDF